MALTDPLTGLYNQRYLMRHLRGLLDAAQSRELAVLMIDVDHFKAVNDDYGHAAGDKALRGIADALRASTRVFDSLARYGGEEFVVVMPGTGARSDAVQAAERLRAAVEAMPFSPGAGTTSAADRQHRRRLLQPASRSPPEALLQAADVALYRAKRAGRNRVESLRAPVAPSG